MDLTWTIEYAVQVGRARIVSFVWLLLLIGLRAAESSVDRRVFGVVTVASTLVFIASWLAVAISDFGGAWIAGAVASMSEPAVFSRAKAGHQSGKGCQGFWFFLTEVAGEPLISDAMFKGREGFGAGQSTIWFFLIKNLVQSFLAESPGCWTM